jgi:hypothetical protein
MESALSHSLSPALIAQYQTQLPDKKLLQANGRRSHRNQSDIYY